MYPDMRLPQAEFKQNLASSIRENMPNVGNEGFQAHVLLSLEW